MSCALHRVTTLGQTEYFGINTKNVLKKNILWLLHLHYIKLIFLLTVGFQINL